MATPLLGTSLDGYGGSLEGTSGRATDGDHRPRAGRDVALDPHGQVRRGGRAMHRIGLDAPAGTAPLFTTRDDHFERVARHRFGDRARARVADRSEEAGGAEEQGGALPRSAITPAMSVSQALRCAP